MSIPLSKSFFNSLKNEFILCTFAEFNPREIPLIAVAPTASPKDAPPVKGIPAMLVIIPIQLIAILIPFFILSFFF